MLKYFYNNNINFNDINKVFDIADKEFGVGSNSNMYNPTEEEFYNIQKKYPFSFCIIKNNNNVVGYVILFPCSNKLMTDFLNKKINEHELVKEIDKNITLENVECLYLMSAYIDKEYRRKGIITEIYKKMIDFYFKKILN